MKLITLRLPEKYIRDLDQLVTEKFYPNRNEAIRFSIHNMLIDARKLELKTNFPCRRSK